MKLTDINDFIPSWKYLERYINDGSDHRFKHQNDVTLDYHPKSNKPSIEIKFLDGIEYTHIGNIKNSTSFPIHPHMSDYYLKQGYTLHEYTEKAAPSSSTRTLFIEGSEPYFLKVDLPITISRFNRRLVKSDVIFSQEINNAISKIKVEKQQRIGFGYLEETGGGYFTDLSGREPGFLERSITPDWITRPPQSNIFIIPTFSLIAHDSNSDLPLLIQMIKNNEANPIEFTLELIIKPLFDFWNLLASHGILWEMQGQNTLIAVDDDFNPVGIIIRDNDAAYINHRLDHPFHKGIHYTKHNLTNENDLEKRTSLIFDHRVCKQNILRFTHCIDEFYGIEYGNKLREAAIQHINSSLHRSVANSLPKNHWYTYAEVSFNDGVVTKTIHNPPLR